MSHTVVPFDEILGELDAVVDQLTVAADAQFNVAIELIRIIGERERKLGGLIGQRGVRKAVNDKGGLGEWRQGHRSYRQLHKCRSFRRYGLYFVLAVAQCISAHAIMRTHGCSEPSQAFAASAANAGLTLLLADAAIRFGGMFHGEGYYRSSLRKPSLLMSLPQLIFWTALIRI